jgi:hypothetical protein
MQTSNQNHRRCIDQLFWYDKLSHLKSSWRPHNTHTAGVANQVHGREVHFWRFLPRITIVAARNHAVGTIASGHIDVFEDQKLAFRASWKHVGR